MALPGSMNSHTLANPAGFLSLSKRAHFWVLPVPDPAILWCWGQNLGPCACWASSLSLGYNPSPNLIHLNSKRKSFTFSSDKDLFRSGYDRLSSRQCCYFSLVLKTFSSSAQQLQLHLESITNSLFLNCFAVSAQTGKTCLLSLRWIVTSHGWLNRLD